MARIVEPGDVASRTEALPETLRGLDLRKGWT